MVCVDKQETEGHWDCEENACDDCCLEYIYEALIALWGITPPETDDDDKEVTFPINYYERIKVVDESSGKLVDRHIYQTDFVPLVEFLNKYLFKVLLFFWTLCMMFRES